MLSYLTGLIKATYGVINYSLALVSTFALGQTYNRHNQPSQPSEGSLKNSHSTGNIGYYTEMSFHGAKAMLYSYTAYQALSGNDLFNTPLNTTLNGLSLALNTSDVYMLSTSKSVSTTSETKRSPHA